MRFARDQCCRDAGADTGFFGPVPAYLMSIGVSPHDEIVFAPYREGPHELWIARLR